MERLHNGLADGLGEAVRYEHLAVDLTGTFLGVKAMVPIMKAAHFRASGFRARLPMVVMACFVETAA